MSRPRLEKQGHGWVLVVDGRLAPAGYVRGNKLRIKSGSDWIEFEPEDLSRLADEVKATGRATSKRLRHPYSLASG